VQHETPDELSTGEACFRNLLNNVNLIAVTVNTDAEIMYCNDYFLQLTGWTLVEIRGRRWREVFVPTSSTAVARLIADMLEIRLVVEPHKVTLEVTDDGIGLPQDVEPDAGVALHIMGYRASILHGQLRVERRAQGGTRIVLACEQPQFQDDISPQAQTSYRPWS
jgi:PAS domain S-box-containing protein